MSCRPATFVSTNHNRDESQVTLEDQWEGGMGTQVFRTCLVAYQEWLSNRREANRRRDEPLVSNRSFKLPTVACWCCRRQAWCNQEAPENPKGFQLRSSATDNSGLGANANRRRFFELLTFAAGTVSIGPAGPNNVRTSEMCTFYMGGSNVSQFKSIIV